MRAVSERAGALSQSDAAALLAEWKESERKEQGMPQKLKTSLSDLPEDSREDESEEERALLIEDDFADDEIVYDEKSTPSHWNVNVLVGALYLGYVFASFALQNLNQLQPGCAQLVSLLQYLSVVAENGTRRNQHCHLEVSTVNLISFPLFPCKKYPKSMEYYPYIFYPLVFGACHSEESGTYPPINSRTFLCRAVMPDRSKSIVSAPAA